MDTDEDEDTLVPVIAPLVIPIRDDLELDITVVVGVVVDVDEGQVVALLSIELFNPLIDSLIFVFKFLVLLPLMLLLFTVPFC